MASNQQPDAFQVQFHRRWNHLNNPHVRALAWLLDSPDLLDAEAPQWGGKIATLGGYDAAGLDYWLSSLDHDPMPLLAAVNSEAQPIHRLGRYAEKLMAFYFRHQGTLVGQGVQVQSVKSIKSEKSATVGEFDFLLRDDAALLHWEFATKFYLLESAGADAAAHYFVGPNLADTLGAKMHKILAQQLMLSQHPAAQIHLPQSVANAQALVKGWLFYRECSQQNQHQNQHQNAMQAEGISDAHCRGFWCTLSDWQAVDAEYTVILPRLQWLAPAKVPLAHMLDKTALAETFKTYFAHDSMPLLLAVLEPRGEYAIEVNRGFIVPDDWPGKAQQYLRGVKAARADQ